jgi:hypothetical protein
VTWELWIPLLVALITVTGGIMTWSLTERARRAQEEYSRREARYSALVGTLHGFYVDTTSPELRGKFIAELELAWLYCPDDVIRKGYGFLNSVQVGSNGDSGVSRTPIPRQGGHAFHGKPDTGSTGRRTLIPLDCGHRRAT